MPAKTPTNRYTKIPPVETGDRVIIPYIACYPLADMGNPSKRIFGQKGYTMLRKAGFFCLVVLQALSLKAFGQVTASADTARAGIRQPRAWLTGGCVAATGSSSLLVLNHVWYRDYPKAPMHAFNDNPEWLQMDKAGHLYTSYQLGTLGYGLARWSGLKEKHSALWGGSLGLMYLTGLELLDGYSAQWGFSWGDAAANLGGTFLFSGQQLLWHEQRIIPKFSFSGNPLYRCNTEQLGNALGEQLVKNYNAQTYWLSINLKSFMKDNNRFPAWLNVCAGYGADGLLTARGKAFEEVVCGDVHTIRTRQFYFSLDAYLSKIKTNSGFLKTTFRILNVIRVPFPTVEYSVNKGWFVHPFYF